MSLHHAGRNDDRDDPQLWILHQTLLERIQRNHLRHYVLDHVRLIHIRSKLVNFPTARALDHEDREETRTTLHCQTAAIMLMGIEQMALRVFANLRRVCLRKWLTFGYVIQDTDVLDHRHEEEDDHPWTQQPPRILCQEVMNKATQPTRAYSWCLKNLLLTKTRMALLRPRRPRQQHRFIAHRSRERAGQQAACTDLALASQAGQWA